METAPYKINSISELHKLLGLPRPLHPLVSIIHNCNVKIARDTFPHALLLDFFKISYMEDLHGKVKYGQGYYDFDEGGMVFVSPNQLLKAPAEADECEGVNVFVHPDFLLGSQLAGNIKKYNFFSYATNEALHLSDKEKSTIMSIYEIIEDELESRIDDFSQDIVISQLDLLLNYSKRFYRRQFITRKAVNNDLLTNLEQALENYLNSDTPLSKGLPTVQCLAEQLHVSPHYLSDMLRALTGQNALQHIQGKLIEKAKEILSTSNLTVAEVAYRLGFEQPQSFNKFFKNKTKISPLEFRQSFN